MPDQPSGPRIGEALLCAAIAMAGLALAMLAVYAGTGLFDGFGDWDLHRIGRRFRRALYWALPLAGIAGFFLAIYYDRLLRPGASALALLWSVVRAFAHFPLFGLLALLAMIWGFVAAIAGGLLRRIFRLGREADRGDLFARWLGPPVWFIVLPFIAMKLPMEGDMELPDTVSRRRLLRWLPAVLAAIMLYADASDADTGERVDPYWLAAFAAFWLADYLIVALRVAPALRARERAEAP